MSPTPEVDECPVSPGEDPHVPAGARAVRARAGLLEGSSLMGRFYQGLLPAPGSLQPSQLPTTEAWKQGSFHSTRNANVLANEVATQEEAAFSLCLPGIGMVPIPPASYTNHFIL